MSGWLEGRLALCGSLLAFGCGGGAAAGDEASEVESTQSGSGGEEGGGGGDDGIQVTVDPPEEGAMVVLDEQGRIAFETNVRLELETMQGTTAAAAQILGHAIQARMTEVRGCYDRAVASDPEVEGSLRLVLAVDPRGRVTCDVGEVGFTGGRITQCVTRILRRLPREELPHDSRIQVILIASNTMAAGSREVREHREQQQQQPER